MKRKREKEGRRGEEESEKMKKLKKKKREKSCARRQKEQWVFNFSASKSFGRGGTQKY